MSYKFPIEPEISWLSFNARVLQEADDPTVPLKERIRFLAIYSNNLDEFFRVRVSVLKKGRKNSQQILDQIHRIVLAQQKNFNRIWKKILTDLKKERVFLVDDKHLNSKQKEFCRNYYDLEVSSSIIPLFIESMAKLPSFADDNIFLGVVMRNGKLEQKFALIEIPTKNHSRFVSLPANPGEQCIILLEELVRFNLPRIFSHLGYTHFEGYMFKVTKDAEIDIDNDISTTFIQKIEKGVKNRRKAKAIRFLYDKKMNRELLEFLIQKLNLSSLDSIIPGGYIRNFRDFLDFPGLLSDSHARPLPFKHPDLAKSLRVSDVIKQRDVLLHLPYHSFNPIIDLLREAAMDPDVKCIKITSYRLAQNSKICNALINAVRNSKEVHVFLELRASFDEAANLDWKTKLEEEGVKVFFGIPNIKVHAKICLIEKRVGQHLELYGFIGTGNLNERTALSYTDHFLLTSHRAIMRDIKRIFKALESPEKEWFQLGKCKKLLVSPVTMRGSLYKLIDNEIKLKGRITLSLNALTDAPLIKKLDEAAAASVTLKLIIRSAFCMRKEPGKTVTARSIVDEYLEHTRIWLFHNGGREKIFLSSADWMPRNLDYRVEVAVPIIDRAIRKELKQILQLKLDDTVKARLLDGELSNQYVSSARKRKFAHKLLFMNI